MRSLSCLLLAGLLALGASAAAPPAKVPAEVLKLIDQLGDDDADVRKEAETKLIAFGEGITPALRKVGKTHADVDVRLRAMVIVAAIEKNLYGEVRRFTGSGDGVIVFAISPDGKRVASGCWKNYTESVVRVWDVETGKELMQLKGHTS